MSSLRQAAQQALEALEVATTPLAKDRQEVLRAITALRAALAEPEQPHDLLCVCGAEWDIYSDGREELVTAPTPRKPLTDAEMPTLFVGGLALNSKATTEIVRAVEKAHGIGEQHE